MKIIKLGVRTIIELVMRCGSIDSHYMGRNRAALGVKIHKKIQKLHSKQAKESSLVYNSEYTLKTSFEYKDYLFEIEGRADGLVLRDGCIHIEEIKSTSMSLGLINPNDMHFAQVKFYGYIYCLENNIDAAKLYLTYCSTENMKEKTFSKEMTFSELRDFFFDVIDMYMDWVKISEKILENRIETGKKAVFPYEYRKGQRDFAKAVYNTLYSRKSFFVQAPTGTGKTISTLFPSIKYISLYPQDKQKIFYITAKNLTRQVAENTIKAIKGLKITTVTLTAKAKICPNLQCSCSPDKCIYADGHFDRVNKCLEEILKNEVMITRDIIESYALRHKVCPFELSLDITGFADIIICDYNYVFDPKASLKRFFDDDSDGNYIILTDEAHNLPDRARDMYSCSIEEEKLLLCLKASKSRGLVKAVSNVLDTIEHIFMNVSEDTVKFSVNQELIDNLSVFVYAADRWLVKNEGHKSYDLVLDLYFQIQDFLSISDYFGSNYAVILHKENNFCIYTLFCADPSPMLRQSLSRASSAVFFSATLSPLSYYTYMLAGNDDDNAAILSSPFDPNNLSVFADTSIAASYSKRQYSYPQTAKSIKKFTEMKKGNYMVFFPSYAYLDSVYQELKNISNAKIIIQSKDMTENEREDFLSYFKEDNSFTLIALVVSGGSFSEGIDLTGEKLTGVCIVSVCLPLVCTQRNVIRDYFDRKFQKGFEFAYIYPAMNKVMQSAGRVIRTQTDKGSVLLIDERFAYPSYRSLLPVHWNIKSFRG